MSDWLKIGPVKVTIGHDPEWTFEAAAVEWQRWNGWACPWFTEEEGRKVAAVSKAAFDKDPDLVQEYIMVREDVPPERRFALYVGEDGSEWDEQPYTLGDGTVIWPLANANWTWEEVRGGEA